MFKINKYLQFRNTPDGKPRVIVEGVDYKLQDNKGLYITSAIPYFLEGKVGIRGIRRVADLADCRPLLTFPYKDKFYSELDIIKCKTDFIQFSTEKFTPYIYTFFNGKAFMFKELQITRWEGEDSRSYSTHWFDCAIFYAHEKTNQIQILGSFFDDPAKYSKLLWDCSEEEGWQKVFKLLEIDLNNQ